MAQKSVASRARCLNIYRHLLVLAAGFWLAAWPVAAQIDHALTGQQDRGAARSEREWELLTLGHPIERELAGGQLHSYRLALTAGQFLRLVVDQRGIDVVVRLFGPDGKQILEVDSPNGARGPEPVLFVAEASGDYRLEVRSLEAGASAGRYEAKVEELRPAAPQDQLGVTAQRMFAEGMRLFLTQGAAESKRAAIEKFTESIPLWRAIGNRVREAHALNFVGEIHFKFGDLRKAIEFSHGALLISQETNDLGSRAVILGNLALYYDQSGDKQKSLDHYALALPLSRAAGDRGGEGVILNNMALLYNSLGEQQQALAYYHEALPLRRDAGDRLGEASTLGGIGVIYNELGEQRQALYYHNLALQLRRAINDQYGEAHTLNSIGKVYYDLGENQQALDYFQQALSVTRTVGARKLEAATLTNIGRIYDNLGEKRKALTYHEESLALRRIVGDRHGEASTLNNLGILYFSLGEAQKASDYYQQALQLWRAVADRNGEAAALYRLAQVERDRGHLTPALDHIEAALGLTESLRAKTPAGALRASYLSGAQNYYELHIDLLMRLHRQNPTQGYAAAALRVSESKRARALLETLAEARADLRQGVETALLERERDLRQRLSDRADRLTRLLNNKGSAEAIAVVQQEIESLEADYQQAQAEIRRVSPRYAALIQPQPLSLAEIQRQVLDTDTLLLEYALGEDRSYLWAVTADSLTSYELPGRGEIERAARRVYDLLTTRNRWIRFETADEMKARVAQADAEYPRAAAALAKMVLGPVAERLTKKQLLIVSDGALQYAPFAALPLSETERRRDGETERRRDKGTGGQGDKETRRQGKSPLPTPLIVNHEIVTLPSASTLAVLRRELEGRTPAPKSVAVLADPVFERNDERFKASFAASPAASFDASSAKALTKPGAATEAGGAGMEMESDLVRSARDVGIDGFRLARLPFTRKEAQAILALVPQRERLAALDFAASKVTIFKPELGQYRYVHIATHGLSNSLRPELSGIVLSLVDERGADQDGFLRAHEVFDLRLPAEMVVLSGCQTGLGKEIKGEGLVGLTRGFMYAGAARVMASLWEVNDQATSHLMARLYQGFLGKRRLSPAAALREAQISLWRDKPWSSPYYWAAFTLQGEPR
jgi:CHAT domain-containing protein/tetratricopeptide (TPR) repeat protein